MFLDNKYSKWYFNLILKVRNRKNLTGYSEKHHIYPKSLKPAWKNDKSNIVTLTAREHFICHLLLTKMTQGQDKQKMYQALHMMTRAGKFSEFRYIPCSRIFAYIREKYSNVVRKNNLGKKWALGRKQSAEEIEKRIQSRRNGAGFKVSEETLQRLRTANLGKKASAETRKKISQAHMGHKYNLGRKQPADEIERRAVRLRGLKRTEETKQKISKAHLGKKMSPESVEKMRSKLKGRKLSPEHLANRIKGQSGDNNPSAKKIMWKTASGLSGFFGNMAEAGKWGNTIQPNISRCCSGRLCSRGYTLKSCGKHPETGESLYWSYA